MPINYTGTRIQSAQGTALMKRINALETVIAGTRWSEVPTQIVYDSVYTNSAGKITCDNSGNFYLNINNGSTLGTSSRVSKVNYDGTVYTEAFILYDIADSGDDSVGTVLDLRANSSALWVANQPPFDPVDLTTNLSCLKKFNLSGVEQAHVERSPSVGINAYGYHFVDILSDNSIVAVWRQRISSPFSNIWRIYTYTSSGGSETLVKEFSLAGNLDTIVSLTVNDDDNILVTVYTDATSSYMTYRYDSGGTLLSSLSATRFYYAYTGNEYFADVPATPAYNVFDITGNGLEYKDFDTLSLSPLDYTEDENNNFIFLNNDGGTDRSVWKFTEVSADRSFEETTFYRYPDRGVKTNPESLGTPDGGVSVPATGALQYLTSGVRHIPHYGTLEDMRTAVETLAPYYANPTTGNAYNLTNPSNDNIFYVAIDNSQYDWTTPAIAPKQAMRATDFSDIDLILEQLEASSLA